MCVSECHVFFFEAPPQEPMCDTPIDHAPLALLPPSAPLTPDRVDNVHHDRTRPTRDTMTPPHSWVLSDDNSVSPPHLPFPPGYPLPISPPKKKQMASLKGEDRYFAEPNVQQLTTKLKSKRPKRAVDDDADEEFSGDLLGCFAVFDGGAVIEGVSSGSRIPPPQKNKNTLMPARRWL